MLRYIKINDYKKLKKNDNVKLVTGEIGVIKDFDKITNEVFIILDPKKVICQYILQDLIVDGKNNH